MNIGHFSFSEMLNFKDAVVFFFSGIDNFISLIILYFH